MEEIELCLQRDDGDIFSFDVELPDDLMVHLLWWIDSHSYALTV